MKNLQIFKNIKSNLAILLVTSIGFYGCQISKSGYQKISKETYETSAMDGQFPLADSSFKYAMKGIEGVKLERDMEMHLRDMYPNMKDQASVVQYGQGIAVYLDRGDAFDMNDDNLNTYAEQALNKLAFHLKQEPNTVILITGRADAIGTENYNDNLAYRRAAIAANYLVKMGIDKERLFIDSFGENAPHFTNKVEEGRDRNRRVDFLILPDNYKRERASK